MGRVNEEIVNYDLIEDILQLILVDPSRNKSLLPPEGADLSTGSVLVFLPGFGEIRSLTERLEGSRALGNKQRFDIIPMHSTLSPQDQRRAFMSPKKGCRKIILSTNIAGRYSEQQTLGDALDISRSHKFTACSPSSETSVTISDVVCGKSLTVASSIQQWVKPHVFFAIQ